MLEGQVTEKTSVIELMKLQYSQELGVLEVKLKVGKKKLDTARGDVKVRTDHATA